MTLNQRSTAIDRPLRRDHVGNRLRRAAGQMTGVLAMYEDGRHPIEILDQLAAARAALDAVALLLLDQYTATCAERLANAQDAEVAIADLTATVRRYVHSR
ncbi:metal-sensing transcriptional repressor [Micromonospora purpureochromogenes]|uniref:metal-sensing transcriptional repressor n=1 Tax=Micromonospora purpureochromogenes TaxID=47872 RepID=UPI003329C43C